MAHRRVEEQIERLNLLRNGPRDEAAAVLRKALADRVGLVVAKAAKLAAELKIHDLLPDLARAFDRLFENPVERDPQCWGKNAIAQAMIDLDYRESAPFLRGARHVQMEPVWGGEEDTAPALRGICLLGLVPCTDLRRQDVLRCLVEALTEAAYTVRLEAVRAVAQMEGDEAALLLRFKARVGDAEAAVAGQVFDALLRLEGAQAVEFVAGFLKSGPVEVRAEAALALGSTRLPRALEVLEGAWKSARDAEFRLALLRAISASRQECAIAFLVDLVRNGRVRDAVAALEALSLHRESPEIRRQVETASRQRTDVEEQFRHWFGVVSPQGTDSGTLPE